MNARLFQYVTATILAGLISMMASAPAKAGIITLTGGDAADASDGIGYAPSGTPVYAYRMIYNDPFHNFGFDNSAYTYKGITFQPFALQGYVITPTFATSTVGSVTITDGFFYPAGASQNIGSGGGALSGDDTLLYDITKYQSFAASSYNGNHGTETVSLGGLIAGRTYQVDLFSANNYGGSEYLYTMQGAGAALPTDVVSVNGSNVQNRAAFIVYDVRENVVADGSGTITITATDDLELTSDNAPINGFSVELTPEPASMALLAGGSLLLLRRRRA